MESSITKIGVDKGLGKLLMADIKALEVRWVQTVTDANGVTKNVGCKAFLRGIPNKVPGIGLELASASENVVTLMVTRYALYALSLIHILWLTEVVARGRIPAPGFLTDPAIRQAYLASEWIGPSQGQLDPTKEVTAAVTAIAHGLSTHEAEAIRINGSEYAAKMCIRDRGRTGKAQPE